MLLAAYDVGDNREILVESPAPAFVALRNRIDYALVSKLIEEEKTPHIQYIGAAGKRRGEEKI